MSTPMTAAEQAYLMGFEKSCNDHGVDPVAAYEYMRKLAEGDEGKEVAKDDEKPAKKDDKSSEKADKPAAPAKPEAPAKPGFMGNALKGGMRGAGGGAVMGGALGGVNGLLAGGITGGKAMAMDANMRRQKGIVKLLKVLAGTATGATLGGVGGTALGAGLGANAGMLQGAINRSALS